MEKQKIFEGNDEKIEEAIEYIFLVAWKILPASLVDQKLQQQRNNYLVAKRNGKTKGLSRDLKIDIIKRFGSFRTSIVIDY